ncbi:PREDICTED: uncharacterized protein LOC106330881 [Brassica oleracea var. oleracea]|uniref:Ubiquitin-like protease family profile domain-containing protein n=1 Tax=Brassica oleracea var. oleracea TaxID=109376 RepID=A0A0D3BIP2_BRAOL|nr:PREDICTED: uncharacterized protein LOC106330881 [Brassica oleracea var. oleracea]
MVRSVLKDEYEEVLQDPVFGPILAILENKLMYSGKIIHSFICKQLKVSKLHELWFVFASRPLRFSQQEIYVVTGLKFKDEPDIEFEDWEDDKGFWSRVLKQNWKISLLSIRTEHLEVCNKWTYVDRVRLVYLCIIQGYLIAKDDRVSIPLEYIRLVMDFSKMRMFPWGLHAYDELIDSIRKATKDLHLKNNYVLDGFSIVFQIWVMEAIPDIGTMVGQKFNKNITKVRCRNWKGSEKVSYEDISSLASHFDKGELFPFIYASGNSDVIDSDQFFREDEKNDERVGRIVALINAKQDWSEFEWEVQALPRNVELSDSEEGVDVGYVTETHVEEPSHVEELVVIARRGKRKINDPGAEARKKQLLCQWVAEHNSGISGQMKTFIEGLFTSLKEVVQKDIEEHFDKVDKEMAQLKEVVSKISGPSDTMGKERASEILCPSARMEKDQWRETSQSLSPSAAKEKGKGKAAETGVPPTVRRSPRPRKEIETDDMLDFLKNLSQSSKNKDMGTREYLQEAVGNLSQASHVRGFDPSQKSSPEEAVKISTPLSSFKPADYKTLSLKDTDLPEDRVNDIDHSLVFVPEDSWVKLRKWCSTSKQHLKIGSSVYTNELAARVMGPAVWLQNDEIDAMLYLFCETTSLGRWNQSKVAFMSCLFSNQMKNSYIDFKKDRKGYKVQGLPHQYGIGELPAHGRTGLMWDLDVSRMYLPLLVHSNHWISMCVNFVTRSIEVFGCGRMKHNKDLEPFAHLIPRIVKAVQSSKSKLIVKPYDVTYTPMPFLNKTSSDCGVYALKHIECHLLGMDLSLVNDDNIREAHLKIAYDLWEAANDPVIISRMSQFIPPNTTTDPVVTIL